MEAGQGNKKGTLIRLEGLKNEATY